MKTVQAWAVFVLDPVGAVVGGLSIHRDEEDAARYANQLRQKLPAANGWDGHVIAFPVTEFLREGPDVSPDVFGMPVV